MVKNINKMKKKIIYNDIWLPRKILNKTPKGNAWFPINILKMIDQM